MYGAVYATSGTNYGVYGESGSATAIGVCGMGTYLGNAIATGVYGTSHSYSGRGVYGEAMSTAGTNYGVYFESASTTGWGVYGYAPFRGVHGKNTGPGGAGVFGETSNLAAFGVYYSGGLAGTGPKACAIKTSQGPTLMYCQKSPENWFEDFGEGQLINGMCHIELDPLFLETVTIDDSNHMKVFVEHRGPCKGTYIETGTASFDVVEQENGSSNAGFCYRVVAKRKGFEVKRLDYCKAAEADPYLYHELREELLRKREEEQVRDSGL